MKREEERELRGVLMGRTLPAEDGRLIALKKGQIHLPLGVTDGAVGAALFGVGKTERCLAADCAAQEAKERAGVLLRRLGQELYLPQQPQTAACFVRYYLTRPAVLLLCEREGVLVLTACTGRGLTGWISRRRALSAFCKRLPKGLSLAAQKPPQKKKLRKRHEKTTGLAASTEPDTERE